MSHETVQGLKMQTPQPAQEYVDKAMALGPEETQELAEKFDARLRNEAGARRLTSTEKAAFQLHFEDQALQQWRANVAALYQRQAA